MIETRTRIVHDFQLKNKRIKEKKAGSGGG